tara:strand:- start:393 stop:623 length:231 start_codon:yes stop_codon:yes gene_type:complete
MKTYQVPCSWQVYTWANVEAESFDDAVEKAQGDLKYSIIDQANSKDPNTNNPIYVQGSFEMDYEVIEYEKERKCNK